MTRLRANFKGGTITNSPLLIGATSATSAEFTSLPVVTSPDTLTIVLDPDSTDPEVAHVTAHASADNTVTLIRGQEATAAREHAAGTVWIHSPTADDFSGGGAISIYWVALTADSIVNPVPTSPTLVPGLTLTIPSSANARMAFVSADLVFTGGHTNRFDLFLDAAAVGIDSRLANITGGNDDYDTQYSMVPVALAAGVEHTIEIRWNASDSTASVTLRRRSLTVMVADGSTSPIGA